jgi:hypothetical protein
MNPIFLPLEFQSNNRSCQNNVIDRYLNDKTDFTGRRIAVSYIHFTDTFHNISDRYGNNKLKYALDGEIFEIIFPDGTYSFADYNNYLHFQMKLNGHYTISGESGVEIYGINISVNTVFSCLSLRILENYSLIIDSNATARFLGINTGSYNSDFNSQNTPDITMGLDTMFVHCSVVNNSIIPEYNTVIFTCPINKKFGENVNFIPNEKRFLTCTNSNTQNLKIWLTNQEGSDINFVENRWGIGIDII